MRRAVAVQNFQEYYPSHMWQHGEYKKLPNRERNEGASQNKAFISHISLSTY